MNCKPGDLAIITGFSLFANLGQVDLRGTIVQCIRVYPTSPAEDPVWEVEERLVRFKVQGAKVRAFIVGVPDSILKPLRDPGDDAIDQFARPLEVMA